MTTYSDRLYAPFVFFTRFGIGVFDEAWLDFRIRAFGAITLPSVTRLLRPGDRWFIFLDRDMPAARLREFQLLIAQNPAASSIKLIYVRYAFDVPDALEDCLRHAMPDRPMYLTRIDDDDALRHDSIHLYIDSALRTEGDEIFITATSAIEFFPVERMMLQGEHSLLSNVAFGRAENLQGFARQGHTKLLSWCERTGRQVAHLHPKHAIFLYTRHRQSSSKFASRRSYARDHDASRRLLSSDIRAFNLDRDRLMEFRAFAATAPAAMDGSSWADSDAHTREALRHWSKMRELKGSLARERVSLLKD